MSLLRACLIGDEHLTIQIYTEKFERDTEMIAEIEVVHHVYDVGAVVRIALLEKFENFDFYERLMVKPLLVANHLSR